MHGKCLFRALDQCETVKVGYARPLDQLLSEYIQSFFAGIVREPFLAHKVARLHVRAPIIAAGIVRMVKKATPSGQQYTSSVTKIGSHDVAVKVDHRIEAVNHCDILVAYRLHVEPVVDEKLNILVVSEAALADFDVVRLYVHDGQPLRKGGQNDAIPAVSGGQIDGMDEIAALEEWLQELLPQRLHERFGVGKVLVVGCPRITGVGSKFFQFIEGDAIHPRFSFWRPECVALYTQSPPLLTSSSLFLRAPKVKEQGRSAPFRLEANQGALV